MSYPDATQRNRSDDTGLAPGWAILADDPPLGMAVLGTLPEAVALNYVTEIGGQRPDVRVVTSNQARGLLAQGAPVAVTAAALPLVPLEVSTDAHYSSLGRTLVELRSVPNRAIPEGARSHMQPWAHDFGSALRMVGGHASADRVTGELVVHLVWEAAGPIAQDWSVSVRLTQAGQEIAQVDAAHPVFGAYPMRRWAPGEIVVDAYPVKLPAGATPDGLTVVVYRQKPDGDFANLDVARFALTD